MRLFPLFMAMYIIFLPLMPCADREECSEKEPAATGIAYPENHEHEEDEEGCTPFCCCSCCPATVLMQPPGHYAGITLPKDPGHFPYHRELNSVVVHFIWQPPKPVNAIIA